LIISESRVCTLAAPQRIIDTRGGLGTPPGMLRNHEIRTIDVTGVGGIPAAGVASVVLNLISTGGSGNSFFTQFPSGEQLPVGSALNWARGQTANNYVVAKVGPGGLVNIYNDSGSTHLVVDVVGWYSS
jgi:hypothetical protein